MTVPLEIIVNQFDVPPIVRSPRPGRASGVGIVNGQAPLVLNSVGTASGVGAALGISPGPYVASAVNWNFNNHPNIQISSLTATDSAQWSISYWINGNIARTAFNGAVLFVVDPASNFEPEGWASTTAQVKFYSQNTSSNRYWETFTAPGASSGWNHFLYSVDTTNGPGSRVSALYINDVLTSRTTLDHDTGSGFNSPFSGKTFVFGDDASGFSNLNTDVADIWFAPNVSLLSMTTPGTIDTSVRRQFIDGSGKPVNPSFFPSSAILFSGNATTFPVNQGTGGSAILTGTITNASSHP
jgi:hypothetical protein